MKSPHALGAAAVPMATVADPVADRGRPHSVDLSAEDRTTLGELARKLERLAPSRHRPELYFETKSEIVDTLRRLSRG